MRWFVRDVAGRSVVIRYDREHLGCEATADGINWVLRNVPLTCGSHIEPGFDEVPEREAIEILAALPAPDSDRRWFVQHIASRALLARMSAEEVVCEATLDGVNWQPTTFPTAYLMRGEMSIDELTEPEALELLARLPVGPM